MAEIDQGVISQYNDGFVSYDDGILYVRDNQMNIIDTLPFDGGDGNFGLTLDGLAVSYDGNEILDVKTGDTIETDFGSEVSDHRDFVKNGKSILIDGEWQKDFRVFCTRDGRDGKSYVNFDYDKIYQSKLENDFIDYIYKNGKSILVYQDYVKVYEGELYSIQRFNDLIDSKGFFDREKKKVFDEERFFDEEGFLDEDYAELLSIYNINLTSIKVFPEHISFGHYILDVVENDMYLSCLKIIGIIGDDIFSFNGIHMYKHLPCKIENTI